MSKTSRELNYAALIVGAKGTGKSTKLCKIARAYAKANPDKKALIIDVNGSPAYDGVKEIKIDELRLLRSGLVKIVGTPTDGELAEIAKIYVDGLVVFEDCTKYIYGNPQPVIRGFLTDHRMRSCDLIFTFHSLKRVPPFFWEMCAYVTVLKTQETFAKSQNENRVPNYPAVADAFKKVQISKDRYYSVTVETMI